MRDSALAITGGRQGDGPAAVALGHQSVALAIPAIEVADQVGGLDSRCVLAELDGLCGRIDMESHALIALAELRQSTLVLLDPIVPFLVLAIPRAQPVGKRLEPWVDTDDLGAIGGLAKVGRYDAAVAAHGGWIGGRGGWR